MAEFKSYIAQNAGAKKKIAGLMLAVLLCCAVQHLQAQMSFNVIENERYGKSANPVRNDWAKPVLPGEQGAALQKIVNTSIECMAVGLVILTIMLIRSNKKRQLANRLLDQKIKERTRELEYSRQALLRAMREREMLLSKASSDIKNSIATIKGICNVCMKDIMDPEARRYMHKVQETSETLIQVIKRYF